MTAIYRVFFFAASLMLIASCGQTDDVESSGQLRTGQFWDSPVSGLEFETPTQKGTTDEKGAFQYRVGERVTFKLGKTVLGSAKGSSQISPFDLLLLPVPGLSDLNDEILKMFLDNGVTAFEHGVNILIFLQSLDADDNPGNGIEISSVVAEFFLLIFDAILFEQDNDAFVSAFFLLFSQLVSEGMLERSDNPKIVDHKDAIEHFYKESGINVNL